MSSIIPASIDNLIPSLAARRAVDARIARFSALPLMEGR